MAAEIAAESQTAFAKPRFEIAKPLLVIHSGDRTRHLRPNSGRARQASAVAVAAAEETARHEAGRELHPDGCACRPGTAGYRTGDWATAKCEPAFVAKSRKRCAKSAAVEPDGRPAGQTVEDSQKFRDQSSEREEGFYTICDEMKKVYSGRRRRYAPVRQSHRGSCYSEWRCERAALTERAKW